MTINEVNDKIQALNSRLDNYITDLQFSGARIDKADLAKRVESIQRVILNNPTVRDILAGEDDRLRNEYINAINNGIQETTRLLEQFRLSESSKTKANIISEVEKDANKDLRGITEGIVEVTNGDMVLKDDERMEDLETKIRIVEKGLKYSGKVEEIKNLLFIEGRDATLAEAVKEVTEVNKYLEIVGKGLVTINSSKNENLEDLISEYFIKAGKGENVEALVTKIRELAVNLDEIDNMDPSDTNKVNAKEGMPKTEAEFKDPMLVGDWLVKLGSKTTIPEFKEKLSFDSAFIEGRRDLIKTNFKNILNASIVLKNFDPDKFETIKDFDCGYDEVKKYIDEALEGIKATKAVEGKEPSEIKRFIADAKKLYDSYTLTKTNPNQVTFNGKTRVLSGSGVDMTDGTKAEAAVTAIKSLADDDEFKMEFDAKVKEKVDSALAAYPRPEYGRIKGFLYKLRKIVTFGIVKTPKEKYDRIYAETKSNKEVEVTENIIEKNKEQRENAEAEVKNDKDLFRKTAIKKVIESKKKLDAKKDKRAVLQKRDKNDSFTR